MGPRRLLLVDDSEDDRALTLRALRPYAEAWSVTVAVDGMEAVDRLGLVSGAHPERFDSVLLDIKMPRLDGLQVLERLRANAETQHLDVILFTSSNEPRDVLRARELGARFVTKPIDYADFLAAVRDALGVGSKGSAEDAT